MNPSPHVIKVLVVEDSAVVRDLLVHILASDPCLKVVECVSSGEDAIEAVGRSKPDVVTMDIHMPGIDGFQATRRIMESSPVPIVIVSASYDPADVKKTFLAMDAGAVAAVEKPRGPHDPHAAKLARQLVDTVKAMSEVRVIRRRSRPVPEKAAPARLDIPPEGRTIRIVAIGASTGGPPVLQTILQALPKPFPVPILIVQHISAGFAQGLADWLSQAAAMPVQLARHGDEPAAGTAYLAPDGCQMRVTRGGRLSCLAEDPVNGLRPAVACLFQSVAEVFGRDSAAVLLTGMGRDGARELKALRECGAVTIAQDKLSSIIHGMPGEAIRLGGAGLVLSPERIAATLEVLVSRTSA